MVASSQKQSKTPEPKTTQAASSDANDVHEMLFTDEGLLAFDAPKDWERSDGPGCWWKYSAKLLTMRS